MYMGFFYMYIYRPMYVCTYTWPCKYIKLKEVEEKFLTCKTAVVAEREYPF